jgi:hypothetical protein
MKLTMATLITVAVLLTIGITSAQPVPAPTSSAPRQVTTQTPDEDLWLTEMSFERAVTTKQHDAAQRMFHTDFVGVDADGSTYAADAYFVRRSAESLFFDVDDEFYPGGGIALGTVLIGNSVQRFSHIWLQTARGWRLVAAQASTIRDLQRNAPAAASRAGADEATFLKDRSTRPAAESAIVDTLRKLVLAEHASDANAWGALTDDHFWTISVRGAKDSKGARMGQIGRQRAATLLPTFHVLQIRIYGDLAIMRNLQEPVTPPAVRGTRLWVRHGDVWQQALNHGTFIAASARK